MPPWPAAVLGLASPRSVGMPLTGHPHKAVAQEIEVGTAKHLALEHFEAIDVTFDGAVTPRHGHPRFDSRIVVAQPLRKTLQDRSYTGRGASEPAIEALRLAGPHEIRKVPGQCDRLRELRLLCGQQGQLLFLVRLPGLRTPQDEPGGPPRREVAVLGFRDDGQRVRRRGRLAGCQPLDETADVHWCAGGCTLVALASCSWGSEAKGRPSGPVLCLRARSFRGHAHRLPTICLKA